MTVLQALDSYYGRMAARGDVVAPGWSMEPVGALLDLAEDGTLIEVVERLNDRGKPQPLRVPKWFSRSGTGSTPNFLWDNAAYVLGLGGGKDPAKTARDHAAFRALHLEALADATDPGLLAVRRFIERWTPEDGPPVGLTSKLLPLALSFRFKGDPITRRPGVDALVERLSTAKAAGPEGFCLVRGERLPLMQLHPKIKGVDGTASAEVPLVSFNAPAFESYGQDQGMNAPTSRAAGFRYGAALNELLTRGGPHRLRLAESTVAFWADGSDLEAEKAAAAEAIAEETFSSFIDPPSSGPEADSQRALDLGETMKVHMALAKVAKGRPEAPTTPEILEKVRFYVLGLTPNVARLTVRYWLTGRFEQFAAALDAHAEALAIEPKPWKQAPSVKLLLARTTALMGKFDNIPDALAGEVLRAILTGAPYPRTWLATVLMRLHAGDDPTSGWHAAALKACINRTAGEEPIPVRLDPENPSTAYQLGRLFAVIERAQQEALGFDLNSTVVDRFYASASSTPARVFGSLMDGLRTHISAAHKLNKGWWIDGTLNEIFLQLPPEIPKTLGIEDQCRFAVGYYHQRATKRDKPSGDDEPQPTTDGDKR